MGPGVRRDDIVIPPSAVMMVMVVMMTPAIVMMVVVMVPVGELDAALFGACALLLIQRFQPRAGIRDRLQQFGIGVGGEHISRRRSGRGLCGSNGSERGHRSQKSGQLLVQSDLSLILPLRQTAHDSVRSAWNPERRTSQAACGSWATRLFSDLRCQRAETVSCVRLHARLRNPAAHSASE
jgi:hypothetical protein